MSRLDSQDLGMQGYLYEPEYSEEELASMATNTESTDVATDSEIQDEDATQYRHERLTDLETWCICSNCCLMPTVEESKCCTEYLACEAKMPDGQQGQCITTHPKFATVCIDDTVLDLTISIVHDFRGNVAEGEHSNEYYRLAAYRTFTWWMYKKLGFGVRKVIPSCVVTAIRNRFPAEDNVYTGFKRSEIQAALSI